MIPTTGSLRNESPATASRNHRKPVTTRGYPRTGTAGIRCGSTSFTSTSGRSSARSTSTATTSHSIDGSLTRHRSDTRQFLCRCLPRIQGPQGSPKFSVGEPKGLRILLRRSRARFGCADIQLWMLEKTCIARLLSHGNSGVDRAPRANCGVRAWDDGTQAVSKPRWQDRMCPH